MVGCVFRVRYWLVVVVWLGVLLLPSLPAQAATDPYVTRYLRLTEPIVLEFDDKGDSTLR